MTDYHNPESCNKCAGENKVTETDTGEGGLMHEGKTKCKTCGFEDYWAYGFFESGTEMISKCKTYNFDNKRG